MTQPDYPLPFPRAAQGDPVPSDVWNAMEEWIEYLQTLINPPAMAAGQVTITPNTAQSSNWGNYNSGTADITLPGGLFSEAPTVTVSTNTSLPGSKVIEVSVSAVSATGFTINLARIDTFQTICYWQAIQQTQ